MGKPEYSENLSHCQCPPKIPHVGLGLKMGLHGKELVTNYLALVHPLTLL
jgi:hypothetical protein